MTRTSRLVNFCYTKLLRLFILILQIFGSPSAYGQTPNNLTLFGRPTSPGIIQVLSMPYSAAVQQAGVNNFHQNPGQQIQNQLPGYIFNGQSSIAQQNRQTIQNQWLSVNGVSSAQQVLAIAEAEREFLERKVYGEQLEWMHRTKAYREAFRILDSLNPDNFSITKATFTVENAFYENKLNYYMFEETVKQKAELVKQILKREKLDTKNNTALNYGIMKLYQQQNNYYDSRSKRVISVKPFRYDFNDFRGEKNYANMFTSKMLSTGKGQCHSMPLTYLMIAEQLGAKAYLSLAPQHSFIQFVDDNNNLINFETTNGNLVSSNWLQQSGFINANALKSRTYLDTLSQRQLYARCLTDLLLGYMDKFGYDDFAEKVKQKILQINPNNITANIIEANIKTQIALQKINAVGRPKVQDLPNFPEAYNAYLNVQAAYEKVESLGYQNMPEEAYKKWLKSMELEKAKQEDKELRERIRREVGRLKKLQSTVVDRTRN
jgi:hypothetical protein